MAFSESEKEWAKRVAGHLKAELKRAGVTYEELALRLKGVRLRRNQGEHHKQDFARDIERAFFPRKPRGDRPLQLAR
jgi:hypothetical protein